MAYKNTTVSFEDNVVLQPRDDPINILSIEASRTIDKFILAFQPCVVVIGLSTNVVNIVVFCRQGLRDRMNLCLFCLSLADLCYLVTILFVLTVSSIITQVDQNVGAVYSVKSMTYGLGFIFGTAALSRLISMVIAVERCLCVVFPLQATSLVKTRTMARIFLTIVIATSITVVRLRAAMSWRKMTSSSSSVDQSQQMALTKMLVIISCIDITCSTLFVSQALVENIRSDFFVGGPYYNLVNLTGSLSTVFNSLNSSINFFVYITRSTRYRYELQLLCRSRIALKTKRKP
ncbi:uncharacterized protein LOC112566942 [Pomacea canaliculata]|uniref:uncharacterized protein LOC112566942 n=1 Tax=Pomacea canaliculata TaxID=400727 RepID=UPI000D72BDC2|nr:uncharacterized protein LOC112566942 [Pomacea canaliculata]